MLFNRKKNLLLLGASGGVANAFLHHLPLYRHLFKDIYLLDQLNDVLTDQFIDHAELNYTFIHKRLEPLTEEKEYIALLHKYKIDIVLDLTDEDTIALLESTNKAGVNYINTALNSDPLTTNEIAANIFHNRQKLKSATHILASGMNPGVVNMWVRFGIEKHGKPKEIIHFEYDTATPSAAWKLMQTWSIKEFLVEAVRDPAGLALGENNIKKFEPNALMTQVDMTDILKPIIKLPKYPKGMQVLHEENITVAKKYDIPSQFLYAINMKTMDKLVQIYKKKKDVAESDMIRADNREIPLDGSDSIGVILRYDGHDVYYFNSAPNSSAIGTSGTYTQVVVGVYAALFTLMFDNLKKGLYFVEDLYSTHYKNFLFDNMRVSEYIFKDGTLKKFTPVIKLKSEKNFNHKYIL